MEENEEMAKQAEAQEKLNTVEERIQAYAQMQKQLKDFNVHAQEVLDELFKTDSKIQQEVSNEFFKAVAETGLSITEVGREYRARLNENFQDILVKAPKDRVLKPQERNLITATLLNIFKPIDEFVKDEESRREGLMHVYFLNAALRSIPVRYDGCKRDWDLEDEHLKEVKTNVQQ